MTTQNRHSNNSYFVYSGNSNVLYYCKTFQILDDNGEFCFYIQCCIYKLRMFALLCPMIAWHDDREFEIDFTNAFSKFCYILYSTCMVVVPTWACVQSTVRCVLSVKLDLIYRNTFFLVSGGCGDSVFSCSLAVTLNSKIRLEAGNYLSHTKTHTPIILIRIKTLGPILTDQ